MFSTETIYFSLKVQYAGFLRIIKLILTQRESLLFHTKDLFNNVEVKSICKPTALCMYSTIMHLLFT